MGGWGSSGSAPGPPYAISRNLEGRSYTPNGQGSDELVDDAELMLKHFLLISVHSEVEDMGEVFS